MMKKTSQPTEPSSAPEECCPWRRSQPPTHGPGDTI